MSTPSNQRLTYEMWQMAAPQSRVSQLLLRIVSAGIIGLGSWTVAPEGARWWVAPWFLVLIVIETFARYRLMLNRKAMESNDEAVMQRTARHTIGYTVVLAAVYSAPTLILVDKGGIATLFAFLVACGICMNVASQHIQTKSLVFLTLPLPGLAVVLGAVNLAGEGNMVIALFLAGGMLAQALSFNSLSHQFFKKLIKARGDAETASAAKSSFLANMSHELRTPLNAILGYAQLMQEDATQEKRKADVEDLQRILSASRRLQHLINDLLDLSKMDANAIKLEVAPFDIAARLTEVAEVVRPSAKANNTCIRLDLPADLGSAQNDAFRFDQCMLNLLSNAAKFTQDGVITVRARRETGPAGAQMLTVDVSDTGIGITEEQQAAIFRPFEQADASITRKYGGTGLGLALTLRLAKWLGGDLSVKSKLGEGACFTLAVRADFPVSPEVDLDLPASAEIVAA